MKLILLLTAALASGVGVGYSIQDKDKKPAGQAAGQEMPKPGPEHAMLQKGAGTWDAVVSCTDEKGQPATSKGTCNVTKLGDFYTLETFEGEFMGQKFTGHGINAYCPIRKQYMTFWADSMSPTPMLMTGTYDEKTKQTTMTGECCGMSGKLEKCKAVIKHKDADHYSFAMHGAGPDGKEMQMLQIEYTRRK